MNEELQEDLHIAGQTLRFNGRTFPLLYALSCPFSGRPIVLAARNRRKRGQPPGPLGSHYTAQNWARHNDVEALAFARYGEEELVTLGERHLYVQYFFGFGLDKLLRDAWNSASQSGGPGRDFLDFEEFKNTVLIGRDPQCKVAAESIRKRDSLVALCVEESRHHENY
jgi:hypothetical protein